MQINLNTNYCSTPKQNPAFGSIKLYGGSADVLKKVLKPEEWLEFKEIAANAAKNNDADAIFWSRGSKKLVGRAVTQYNEISKDYSQRLFEGTLSFVKRVCGNADTIGEKFRQQKQINNDMDAILDNLK